MEKGKVYQSLLSNQEEALAIIKDGGDDEMVEMAKMQLDEAKEQLPGLEEEIKYMLIPKDPPVFLQETYIECTLNIAQIAAGLPV